MGNQGTCKHEACEGEVQRRGYCRRHFSMWKKGDLPKARYKSCNKDDCHKPMFLRGLCEEHSKKAPAAGVDSGEGAAAESPSAEAPAEA